MMNRLAIYNKALALLGEMPLSSLEDKTKACELLNTIYACVRDKLLRDHHWRFAIRRRTIRPSQVGPAFKYIYRYSLPDDCLKVLDVYPHYIDYTLEGGYILTDESILNIRYVFRNTQVCSWDLSFCDALAAALAAEIAYNLTGSHEREGSLMQLYERKLAAAKSSSGQEIGRMEFIVDDWLNSKY